MHVVFGLITNHCLSDSLYTLLFFSLGLLFLNRQAISVFCLLLAVHVSTIRGLVFLLDPFLDLFSQQIRRRGPGSNDDPRKGTDDHPPRPTWKTYPGGRTYIP